MSKIEFKKKYKVFCSNVQCSKRQDCARFNENAETEFEPFLIKENPKKWKCDVYAKKKEGIKCD